MPSASKKHMPQELVQLIRDSVKILGEVLQEELGQEAFKRIESLRRAGKSLGSKRTSAWENKLQEIADWSAQERLETAHAFGLMLELINSCETSYRTYRLRHQESESKPGRAPERIVWVLTAHPTEARSPASLRIFQQIQNQLIENLEQKSNSSRIYLKSLLHIAWRASFSKLAQPSVKDEAENIYSILFREELIEEILQLHSQGLPLYFRTWVGGDKDGHPGVDEKTMLESWNLARRHLLEVSNRYLDKIHELLKIVCEQPFASQSDARLVRQLTEIQSRLLDLSQVRSGDGSKIKSLRASLDEFQKQLWGSTKVTLPDLEKLQRLLEIFPGLVVPLELREEADIVQEALQNSELAIARMLKTLREVSSGHDPRIYARALVLSQTESLAGLEGGWELAARYFPQQNLPVVPLLESEKALKEGPEWIQHLSRDKKRLKVLKDNFGGHFEIMLGYSDSAKESGSLSSRFLIFQSLDQLEKGLTQLGLQPIFFHGSGGSVSRGGGPIREQMSWWSPSALKYFKATLQGEMIQRTFATPEILRSQVRQIALQSAEARSYKMPKKERQTLEVFQAQVQSFYREAIENPDFLHAVEAASPYSFLHHLKIGSRPNKRKGPLSVKSLRAIPWVLCWTQMRALFPVWWGVGRAWQKTPAADRKILKAAAQKNPLLHSYLHLLGFTLAKVELPVLKAYLMKSQLPDEAKAEFIQQFENEYRLTVIAFQQLTGKRDFLWRRPWLGDSIAWRSPMIHPLNLLQLVALEKEETLLLRETVTGIASGMMTTG